MSSSVKKEQKKLLEGVLVGMKYFLINHSDQFPRDAKKKSQRLDFLFQCVKIGLLPEANTTRYSTIRAALSLLIKHSALFSEYLCASCEEILSLLMPACNHTNREVKTRATAALEVVLGQVSTFMVKMKDAAAGKENQKLFNVWPPPVYSACRLLLLLICPLVVVGTCARRCSFISRINWMRRQRMTYQSPSAHSVNWQKRLTRLWDTPNY